MADTEEEAITTWNTRKPDAALVAALKAVLAYPCACYSVMDPNWHSDTCIKTTVRAALRDAGEPL
jgi:hypothetical protein